MYSTLGENVGRSNSLEIIQIIDLPGEILPEAGRPRYFREISIVDFFPIRFVHAKDDGTIVSRSKSQREKLVDDRSRVQSNQRFSNMRSKDKYATRLKTVTFMGIVVQANFGSAFRFEYWTRLFYDDYIIRRPSLIRARASRVSKREERISPRTCLWSNALQST